MDIKMAISPLEFNGTITRTQEYSAMKQHEDNKAMLEQSHISVQVEKETKHHMNQVREGDDTPKEGNESESDRKGKNSYEGDGGKNRPKENKNSDGKMIVKGSSRFDISI